MSRRAVAKRRRKRENIHPLPNYMSGMGLAATVRVEPDVCLRPHIATSGHRLTGQWAISFITWEKPVPRLAVAQRLEQLQRVGADADGAGLTPLAEEVNVATLIQRFDVFPAQPAQLGDTTAQQVGTADLHIVTRSNGGAFTFAALMTPELMSDPTQPAVWPTGADIPVLRGLGCAALLSQLLA